MYSPKRYEKTDGETNCSDGETDCSGGKKERKSIGAASSPLDKYPTGVYYSGERKERR